MVVTAISIGPASAAARVCSPAGLHPAVKEIEANGSVSCATARKLIGPATNAAARAGRYNTHAVHVHGFKCHVLRFAGSHRPFGGHCAAGRASFNWSVV